MGENLCHEPTNGDPLQNGDGSLALTRKIDCLPQRPSNPGHEFKNVVHSALADFASNAVKGEIDRARRVQKGGSSAAHAALEKALE